MAETAALFPFSRRMLPVIRHFNHAQNKYDIQRSITWSGLGLNGRDIAYSCRQPDTGIRITTPSNDDSTGWDTLLVDCEAVSDPLMQRQSFAFIGQCLSNNKEAVLVCKNEGDLLANAKWRKLYQAHHDKIRILSACAILKEYNEGSGFRNISTPVVLVGGFAKHCDDLEVMLSLRDSLSARGVRVSCFTDCNMACLLGAHSYAHILGDSVHLSEADKIVNLNEFVRNVILSERPAILLFEAPEGLMKFSDHVHNGFGVLTYMISEAISPDFLICGVPIDLANETFFSTISEGIHQRFGLPIGAVHVSNYVIDSMQSITTQSISFAHVELDRVASMVSALPDSHFPMFNSLIDGCDAISDHIIQALL